jgi:hypothetical protein
VKRQTYLGEQVEQQGRQVRASSQRLLGRQQDGLALQRGWGRRQLAQQAAMGLRVVSGKRVVLGALLLGLLKLGLRLGERAHIDERVTREGILLVMVKLV